MSDTKPLPPDPEGMNEQRARRAHEALTTFAAATGLDIVAEPDAVATDLLANLLHWCDRHDQDFAVLVSRATRHYEEEVTDA